MGCPFDSPSEEGDPTGSLQAGVLSCGGYGSPSRGTFPQPRPALRRETGEGNKGNNKQTTHLLHNTPSKGYLGMERGGWWRKSFETIKGEVDIPVISIISSIISIMQLGQVNVVLTVTATGATGLAMKT